VTTAPAPVPAPPWASRLKVTEARVVLSEWTKLRSLRSTRWSMFAAILITVGLSCLFAAITAARWSHMSLIEQSRRHPLDIALFSVHLSQLAIGVLGVLVITGEYSTGMIRATMGAVPKRLPVLWAKIAVYAAVSFLLMLPSVLASFFLSQAILSNHHILQISFTAPGVARSVIGAALYLSVGGVFALALGAMTRNTAGGIAIFAALIFVIPPLLNILPLSWNNAISPYLPSNAGGAVFALTRDSNSFAPWTGFALYVGYTVLAIGVAAVLLVRRDT
jgi:ABC-2 type transport system permease protein